jgi:hypothetical protein
MTITAPITIRTTAIVLTTQSPFIDCIEQLMGPCWPPPPIELRLGVGDVTRSGTLAKGIEMSLVTILVVILLVLLVIYLARRIF